MNRFQNPFWLNLNQKFSLMNEIITIDEINDFLLKITDDYEYVDGEKITQMIWLTFNHRHIRLVNTERWKDEFKGYLMIILMDILAKLNEKNRDLEEYYMLDSEEWIDRDIGLVTRQDIDNTENSHTVQNTINQRLFDEVEQMDQDVNTVNKTTTNTTQNTQDTFFQNPQTGGTPPNNDFATTSNVGTATTNSLQDFVGNQNTDRTTQINNTTDFNEDLEADVNTQRDTGTDFVSDEVKHQHTRRDRGDIQNRVAIIMQAYSVNLYQDIINYLKPLFLSVSIDMEEWELM